MGALKKRLENRIRGWLPNEPKLPSGKVKVADAKNKVSKPGWWKPFWMALVAIAVIFVVINYFLFHYSLSNVIGGLAITLLGIGAAYYIRVRPSMKVNRTLYILLGITPLGFVLSVAYAFFIGRHVTGWLWGWFNITVTVGILITGAFIGDWIGRRRNYRLPLSP